MSQSPPIDAREELAYALGVQAFIYGYPLVEMVRTCAAVTAVDQPQTNGRAPINRFSHSERPWTHEDRDIVTPANDLLYSMAWLNLAGGPVVLSIPPSTGRYFVMALVDAYTNNFRNLGPRTVGPAGGDVALVGPRVASQWSGALPPGTAEVRAPTDLVWILGRVLVDGEGDLPVARAFQRRFALATQGPSERPESVQRYQDDHADPLAFFANLSRALADNPPDADEQALTAQFSRIGLAPGAAVNAAVLDPPVARGLARAATAGRAIIEGYTRSQRARSWGMNLKVGRFGADYVGRACTAMKGLGGLASDEAVYAMSDYDAAGERLHGSRRYVLRFPAGALPPADAFWSVSMYGEDYFFVDNPIRRYAIGDRTPGLRSDADGALDILIQHERPPVQDSNWLPAPAGHFYLILRMYHPREEVLARRYAIPAVTRVG